MDNQLRSLQLVMLEMLKIFDFKCRENNINYSLHGGTLLGAVRHKGFIPWDDDLDVIMTRENYEKFISAWNENVPKGYFLQMKETEEEYTRGFAKIRKDHTLFLQDSENPKTMHTGIFIDVFPVDRIPNRGINFCIFMWNCMRYQLYTREFIPPKENVLVRTVSWLMLKTTNHRQRMNRRKKLLAKITKYNQQPQLRLAVLETPWHIKHPFPPELFDVYNEIWFEDQNFMCIDNWEELLSNWYGDFMSLPPEKDRVWKHYPKYFSLNCNYREYMNEMK